MESFISYDGLPIRSGGGHSLGKLNPKEAYERTKGLLQQFGDNSFPNEITLEQYRAENNEFNSSQLHWETRKKFGWFPRREVWRFPDGKQRLWHWKIPYRKKDAALKHLNKLKELPKHEFGPLNIRMNWNFKLIDLQTKKLLPNQHLIPTIDFRLPNNSARLTLSHKSTLAIWIVFPFSDPSNEEFRMYLEDMKKVAPFKFSDKNWRLWKKSKKGNWNPNKIEI